MSYIFVYMTTMQQSYYIASNEWLQPFISKYSSYHEQYTIYVIISNELEWDQFVFHLSDLELLSREPTGTSIVAYFKHKLE